MESWIYNHEPKTIQRREFFMKYTAKTMAYNAKNFFYVFPLVILPAFFLSFTVARGDIVAVAQKVTSGSWQEITFWEVFQAVSIFNFSSWETVIAGFFGIAALVVCVALLMAFTDKHMRFGKRTFNGLWEKLNDNLLSTFGVTMLLIVLYELWTVLLTALIMLCLQMPFAAACVFASIVFVAMHAVLTYLVSLGYLWLPCMQITGFRVFEALRYSFILCEPVQMKIIVAQTVSMLLSEFAILAVTLLLPATQAVSVLVTTLLYALLILQFCVRMQIVYFDREQIERADLKHYYDTPRW